MNDIIKTEKKIDKKEFLKNSIVAFIPTVIIITLSRFFVTGALLPLIILFVMPLVVGVIREKKNIQFTKKTITKIVLSELTIVVLVIAFIFLLNKREYATSEVSIDKSSQYSEVQNNLYRNTKYNFRIKFPDGWTISQGDGLHIVQKASSEFGTISVIIQELDGFNVSSIKEIGETKEFTDGIIGLLRDKFSEVKLINYGETKIDNQPAYWVEYSAVYQSLDNVIKITDIAYYLAKGNLYYSIEGGTLSEYYDLIKPIFNNSVQTFVIEK